MNVWLTNLPYFSAKELSCRCCGLIQLDMEFAAILPALRAKWGKPILLSSVCRCAKHNEREGGHPHSLHLITNPKWKTTGTMAADVAWRNWPSDEKLAFARMAHSMGLRVGLHNGFCHVDLGRRMGISPRPFLYGGSWDGAFEIDEVL
jgi:hypothetical protein